MKPFCNQSTCWGKNVIYSWESVPSRGKSSNATKLFTPFNFKALLSAVKQFLYSHVCTIWTLFRVYKRRQNICSHFYKFIFMRSDMDLSNPNFTTSLLRILLTTQTILVISVRGLPICMNNSRRWLWLGRILEILTTISCLPTAVFFFSFLQNECFFWYFYYPQQYKSNF